MKKKDVDEVMEEVQELVSLFAAASDDPTKENLMAFLEQRSKIGRMLKEK